MKRATLLLVALLLSGCGYKPISHYTKSITGESISTEVVMTLEDPERSVVVKDAINEAVLMRFQSRLAPQDRAASHLKVEPVSIVFEPMQRDAQGYIIYYRTRVTLKSTLQPRAKAVREYRTTGTYDFPIEPNSALSDALRFESVKNATLKALDELIANIAISKGTS